MDPLTATQLAADVAGIFLNIVNTVKDIIETMNGAKEALIELLNRCERVRLYLEVFRSLTSRLSNPVERSISLSFNDSAYRQTADEILGFAHKIADASKHSEIWMKFSWVFYKTDVTALVGKLEAREKDLNLVLTFIAAQSSVVTENEIITMKSRAKEWAQITEAFGTTHLNQDSNELGLKHSSEQDKKGPSSHKKSHNNGKQMSPNVISNQPSPNPTKPVLWHGNVLKTGLDPAYLKERARLSDAAYRADWHRLLSSLDTGRRRFGESWCNSFRLRSEDESQGQSLWTPLHQAAYMNAPKKVVEKLIRFGAFRTLPTNKSKGEGRYEDLTAVEIAREVGYSDLWDILTPVIRHFVPPRVLLDLEEKFHALIHAELAGFAHLEHLRLPQLVVLTELENPEMWFPIQPQSQHGRGFLFRFDGRELVVLSVGRNPPQPKQLYRVSATGWTAIQDAVVFRR
ncbi:hypothetical protein IFM61606_05377 [Aspergillus udagawae]|uniref:Uncharacterized protein n=1 Tax=Aspergillus udagawae TaxID=91492 RepID=A0ABQ1B9Y7_9EURO|nr:hypothetical protein IFM51744_07160 [Aspergillus udagawae]GFF97045.1 hypothetical protein IFM53868_08862 [Aspergillus udagawae]GFG16901.1 hypothetical protein IFM5058_08196 [Aspergillus udagawae]GFG25435.1 hypothetical protein IFM61606_05377 [Aspergillus udagawae]